MTSGTSANAGLTAARTNKNDEYYTQLADIEAELRHYRPHFKGKTVLCNCDDPFESNFFKYFAMSFRRLGIKKLSRPAIRALRFKASSSRCTTWRG